MRRYIDTGIAAAEAYANIDRSGLRNTRRARSASASRTSGS